jgi:hypothetical protein
MRLLHTTTSTLEGTAYFEFLPGRYNDRCWGDSSVFLDEGAFGFIEPAFVRLLPDYDHYSFVAIQGPRWSPILAELDRLSSLLNSDPSDLDLAENLGFFSRATQENFFADRTRSIGDVRAMIAALAAWLRETLRSYDCVSLLGL